MDIPGVVDVKGWGAAVMFQEWPVVEYWQGRVSQGPWEGWDDTWRWGSGMMGVGGAE
jgi:hypothetical protein